MLGFSFINQALWLAMLFNTYINLKIIWAPHHPDVLLRIAIGGKANLFARQLRKEREWKMHSRLFAVVMVLFVLLGDNWYD